MATSFISKDGVHGFWVNDALVQIICWGFLNVIDNPSVESAAWTRTEFRKYIYHCSLGYFVGFTTLSLNKYIQTHENEKEFNSLIEDTKKFFSAKGDLIPAEEINAFQHDESTRRTWLHPFETKRAIKILEYIRKVANDIMPIRVDDSIDYSF